MGQILRLSPNEVTLDDRWEDLSKEIANSDSDGLALMTTEESIKVAITPNTDRNTVIGLLEIIKFHLLSETI